MNSKFVHLHLHTEYSVIDGIVRIKPLMKLCREKSIPAVAITDQSNFFGVVKFYKQATQAGIKPIIGAEITVADPAFEKETFALVLLCRNQKGYHNLTKLISKAYLEGNDTGIPIVQSTWLPEHSEGLILLSGGARGDIGKALLKDNHALALKQIDHWMQLFPNAFYLELQRTERQDEERYIESILPIAFEKKIPVVATNGVRFVKRDDFEAHETRVAIHDSYVLDDPRRPRLYTENQYFRSEAEMVELFSDIPSALENSVEIAKRCCVELSLGKNYLPDFPVPEGVSVDEFLTEESKRGLEERLPKLFDINADDFAEKREEYFKRLDIELDVIIKMGFPGYFLIVADFIRWSRENGVPVGPGRGSGAGSIVAYALKITDIDPIHYELLFERFLNPERVSMPDFDIDFCMEGRDRVIEYVAQRYGRQSVSQIITFGTMAAKAVIRDVGRVLGYPYGFVDTLAKLIPFEVGITLDKAMEQEDALRERYQKEPEVQNLINLAKKLEGVVRNAGKHAGGVVIAPSLLTDFTPIYCESGSQNIVAQFDKDDVEAIGLVKFDFLGLRTLTIIKWAVETINQNREATGEVPLDIATIPLDDKETFNLLKQCKTTGVFQLESRGMKDLIKRLQPDSFEEIIALVALFRPGPLQSGMVDDFIDRKHGRAKLEYLHPKLKTILHPTYGVILYQEQVMQIAQILAGYTLGGADMLRRAMGKKKVEEMAKQRAIFLAGAAKNGIKAEGKEQKGPDEIFDLMEKFAGYGFNKSHSAAYAAVSYQTAWLKTHYPAIFLASVLTSEMDHTDKIVIFINECSHLKLKVLSPDVNASAYKFTVTDDKTIRYGLGAIKGVGESAIESMIQSRETDGLFKNIFDFCERVDRKVNKRVLEALVSSGAMDSFGIHRASLLATVPSAIRAAEQQAKNSASGQNDLFGYSFGSDESDEASDDNQSEDLSQDESAQTYVEAEQWDEERRLEGEKKTLGLYFSGHPLDRYKPELKQFVSASLGFIKPDGNKTIIMAGLIIDLRTLLTKRGDRMAFMALSDSTGTVEMAVFSDVLEPNRELFIKDNIVVLEVESNFDENSGTYKMSVKNAYSMDEARALYSRFLRLILKKSEINEETISRIQTILKPYANGSSPITIDYSSPSAKAHLNLDREWWVNPEDKLLRELRRFLGDENVEVCY